jgi:phage terminase small subunit
MMPRKSTELHELHGTKPGRRTADVSGVPGGRPRVPADINALGLRKPFKVMCKTLQERRVLTAGDMDLIRVFVIVQDRHVRNIALLREEGELVTYFRLDSNGQSVPQVKKNLRHDICVTAERQMTDIVTRLGLSPTSKDRAKPTSGAVDTGHKVVPGSVEEMFPDLFIVKKEESQND